jgi:lipoprotein-releasing system permease protein
MSLGIFWGNLIGLGFCFLQDKFHFITMKEADYYLSYAPIRIELLSVVGINIGTLLLTLLFLLLPSMVIARVSPVKAITFK